MELFGRSVLIAVSLIGGCLGLIYIYGKRRFRLLKDAGFPGPEPVVFVGDLIRIMRNGIDLDNKLGKKYGPVFGTWLGGIPFVNVSDPDILKEILIKEFPNFTDRLVFDFDNYPLDLGIFNQKGASWKRLRTIISPTFSGSKLRRMCDHLNVCARKLVANLEVVARKGDEVQIKDYLGAFTMDAIASTAFGIDIDSQSDFENKFLTQTKKIFAVSFFENPIIFLVVLFPSMGQYMKKLGFSSIPRSSLNFFRTSLRQIIEHRKAEPEVDRKKRVDFLELMLDAEDNGDMTTGTHKSSQNKMTTDEIMGQAFLFFIAGYETTASTLHFVAYALATNPEAQNKLIEEVDTIIGENDPNYDNIHKLEYMDQVITETLRLYPVVPMLNRYVSKTTTIKGWTFPEGVYINVNSVVIQRDPKVYPEPTKFKPERWENKSEMHSMSYLPFGHGPRQCIGMRLAQVEMKIALARTLKRMTFVAGPKTPAELTDFKVTGVFSPKVPIVLKVQLR